MLNITTGFVDISDMSGKMDYILTHRKSSMAIEYNSSDC